MNKSTLLIAALMLGLGLGAGYWLSQPATESGASGTAGKSTAKPLFYRNPMNPSVTSPVPAKDYMGMDYIPVYADDQASDIAGTVSIDPTVVQNIGVRTATAKRAALSRAIRAVGRVAFDEQRMTRLHPKVEGWVEQIWINKTGQQVNQDDMMLSLYSPKLVATQQEYLLALNNLETLRESHFEEIRRGAQTLVKSSRERLEMLDVPAHQIKELEQRRKIKKDLHIHAPATGTVIRIGARQGQYVTPQTELYMLVDLTQVWVFADVYEYELPWVKVGDPVEMTLAAQPGKTFRGELAYIYPYAETQTRTTKVRLVFDNPDLLLRPDMFADVTIRSDTQQDAVVIPAEAVVRSGEQDQVFVVTANGKFEPRRVRLGLESGGEVVVLDGVDAGEQLVTSAQFLIDSESKLREAVNKMTPGSGGMAMDAEAQHQHQGMSDHSDPMQHQMQDEPMQTMPSSPEARMTDHSEQMQHQLPDEPIQPMDEMPDHGAHQHD